jgi:signal transduction histidine kinase
VHVFLFRAQVAMQFLPPLTAGPQVWRLPLADPTAAALAEALIGKAEGRAERIGQALSHDAALALWAVVRAHQMDRGQFDTVADLAGWLSGRCLDALRWPTQDAGDTSGPSTSAKREWADLTARSVAAAIGSEELARAETESDPPRAFLLGLLHAAREWLDGAGPSVSSPDGSCLPRRLAQQLARMETATLENPGEDAVVGAVAEAVRVLGDRRRRSPSPRFDPDQLRSLGNRAARQWATEVPGAGRCLPELIERLVELDRLSTDFIEELERQKLTALKEFAYGAGHEINNPLANIATRAQTLLRNETDPERRRALATINSQVFRAHEMIADVMFFARPPQLSLEPVDMIALVEKVLGEIKQDAEQQQTELERTVDEAGDTGLTIAADQEQLAATLKAMCINSLEALGQGGQICVELKNSVAGPRREVQLIVSDDGPGIPAEAREHIFDPFFSGREAGRGLGFGLSKAWRCVTDHGGRIEVDDRPGGGATFTVTLPVEPPRTDA